MGVCYYEGNGVPQDRDKSFELFEKAFQKGDSYIFKGNAPFIIAQRFFKGDGVPQDLTKAVVWYKRVNYFAGNCNYAHAQLTLGDCYRLGQGVEKDIAQAMEYYSRAYIDGKKRNRGLKQLKQLAKEGVEGAEEKVKWAKKRRKDTQKTEREIKKQVAADLREAKKAGKKYIYE